MKVSGRAVLAAGVAALTGGALAFTPSVLPSSMRTIEVLPPVTFTADSTALPVSDEEVRAALELIGDVSTAPGHGKITIRLGTDEGSHALAAALPAANVADEVHRAPAVARTTADPDDSGDPTALDEPGDDPVVLNAASDVINDVYAVTRYWANYVSLELGPWLINWVPFGYLISDQIYIRYPDFVLPVVDSFVYDFLDPVVNNPLDLGVWVTGIGDIINTAVTGVYNGIVSEIQYVLDFGWFPIPLPPLPDFPLPFAGDSTEAAVTLAASEADPATEAAEDTQATKRTEATETAGTAEATEGAGAVAGEVADPEAPAEGDAEQTGEVTGEQTGEQPGELTEEVVDDAGELAEDTGKVGEDTEAPVEEPAPDASGETVPDVDESTGETAEETLDEIIDEALEDGDAPADGETEHAETGDTGTGSEVATDADDGTDSDAIGAETEAGDTAPGE